MRIWTWEIYIITFVATALIFLSGSAIGYYLSSTTNNPLGYQIDNANDNMLSMQLLLSSESKPELFCKMYKQVYPSFDNETWSIGEKLEFLEQNNKAFDISIKYKYYQLEYRDMVLAQKAVELCNESIDNIIYIYSNKEGQCSACKEQGKELWYLRNYYQNTSKRLRIYSFDGSSQDSTIIKMIKETYDYSNYPTLIINDKVFGKFMNEAEMKKELE